MAGFLEVYRYTWQSLPLYVAEFLLLKYTREIANLIKKRGHVASQIFVTKRALLLSPYGVLQLFIFHSQLGADIFKLYDPTIKSNHLFGDPKRARLRKFSHG